MSLVQKYGHVSTSTRAWPFIPSIYRSLPCWTYFHLNYCSTGKRRRYRHSRNTQITNSFPWLQSLKTSTLVEHSPDLYSFPWRWGLYCLVCMIINVSKIVPSASFRGGIVGSQDFSLFVHSSYGIIYRTMILGIAPAVVFSRKSYNRTFEK